MARTVDEIMNREIFVARPEDPADELSKYFTALGIAASPVIKLGGELAGFVSLRDLLGAEVGAAVEDLMSRQVTMVRSGTSIEEAGRVLGETGFHRLPVVDESQNVVGLVSSLDVVRGLLGMPARHPPAFRHLDERTGLLWSEDTELSLDRVDAAPPSPGVVALVRGGVDAEERIVWAEMAPSMRRCVLDWLTLPHSQDASLRYWLEGEGTLRFRTAPLTDRAAARQVIDLLQREAGYARD